MLKKLITPIEELQELEPVDFEMVKIHLEIDNTDRYDDLVMMYIDAAAQHAERLRGEVLVPQTWEMILTTFPTVRQIRLVPRPVRSVTSVKYLVDGVSTDFGTLVGSPEEIQEFELIDNPIRPLLRLRSGFSWPSGAGEVRIRLECGYELNNIPPVVKTAMLMLIGHWFENREAVVTGTIATEVPVGIRAMLYRPRAG